MERIVIVAYKAKPGKLAELRILISTHQAILRGEDLVTDREAILMESADGSVVEVFEWRSVAAIEAAHSNARVTQMWGDFAQVCEFVPVASVPEAAELFSEFSSFNEEE